VLHDAIDVGADCVEKRAKELGGFVIGAVDQFERRCLREPLLASRAAWM